MQIILSLTNMLAVVTYRTRSGVLPASIANCGRASTTVGEFAIGNTLKPGVNPRRNKKDRIYYNIVPEM